MDAQNGWKHAASGAWLTWTDVSLERRVKSGQTRRILKSLNGHAPPGCLVAILGGSGSGKTTLLNCIAQRISDYAGVVSLNGQPFSHSF